MERNIENMGGFIFSMIYCRVFLKKKIDVCIKMIEGKI